ncbi:hypothetical protein HHI36_004094 [Cryptolaemus montrouzieri]|uniref:Uncharacterized protein n=1 Tax=Cryptolaemus montrouzieri TaxID=559131 RepID=A0ABD2NQ65_9CUCU
MDSSKNNSTNNINLPDTPVYQKFSVPESTETSVENTDKRKGGLIFIWPQKRKFYRHKELIFSAWFLAHVFYWMHLLQLLPTDHVLNIKCPPWNYEPPFRKPIVRDFIIEPDWNS